jgi:hypothetical protein
MVDYELHCPFCGEATVDGRCPSCAPLPQRTAPAGTKADRTSAHVDVAQGMKYGGEVDRLAIYTPAGGRSSWFARLATVVAASVSVGIFIVVTLGLLAAFIAALVGSISTSSLLAAVVLGLAAVLALVALTVCATGLFIVWQHRDDYAASRRASASSSTTRGS